MYLPGITAPLVDTEDPEGDELRQAQRAKERQIRKLKRTAQVVEGSTGKTSGQAVKARADVKHAAAEFKTWREANGRKNLAYRTNINPPKAKPVPEFRRRDLPPVDLPPTPSTVTPFDRRPGDPTPEDRIRNAEETFGTGSAEHLAATQRFRPKTAPGKTPRKPRALPADVLDYNTREIRLAPDDDLEDALTRAFEADHPNTDRIMAEIDRRADAPAREAQDKARRAEAARLKRDNAQQAKWDEIARRIDQGDDPREAVADVTGVSVEKQLRTEAFHRLKSEGTPGDTFDQMIRHRYREDVDRRYVDAEGATRGHMLSREAEGRNVKHANNPAMQIDPRALFAGPEARARKWASDELLQWWDENGRPTLDEYRHQEITGTAAVSDRTGASDFLA